MNPYALSLLWLALPVQAEPSPSAPPPVEEPALELPEPAVSRHRVTVAGTEIPYTATAATLTLSTEEGDPKAHVFHVSYMLDEPEDPSSRPVTFVFNGGPGSSSVWLHLGAFGPRRVAMDEQGFPLPPPARLEENGDTLLDVTDLVFIDPVTTGYSRAAPGESADQFHGVRSDIEQMAEFIRLWVTRNDRWGSPKYLCGESYGTTRAAGLAGELQDRHGMYLNGIVLISSILDFQTARFDTGNDLPYILFLPTYTATAFYHGRLSEELSAQDLQATLAQAEEFAYGEYARALLLGNRLGDVERAAIARKLAWFTGLSIGYVESANLRVPIRRFVKELLRDDRRTVGRLDSRFVGRDADAAGERVEFDPSYAAIQGPFTAALNAYVRERLGYRSDLPYEILTDRVHPWSYEGSENRYLNVAETLREAMAKNPALRVFVANGYYDLATPYFATRYTFDHLSMEPEDASRVQMAYYESGHMMYIHRESSAKLKADVAAFLLGPAVAAEENE